jgi:hypothetical protein
MSKPTRQQLLTIALLARGYVLDTATRVTKKVVFRPTAEARSLLKENALRDPLVHRVYVGKAGALRFSSQGTSATSVPFSSRTIARLLDEGAAGGINAYEAALRAARVP